MIKSNNIEMEKQGKLEFENKISTPFTWVENELIRSKSLSYEALGLYLVLRSFWGSVHPSVDYLCSLGRTGRDRLRRIINELLEAKLLIKKQEKQQGLFSRTVYRILSINDDYEQVYEEFTGEKPLNPQTLDNVKSHPLTENPSTENPLTENPPLIRIIKEKESLKTHTRISEEKEKGVCEDEKLKNKPHTPVYLKAIELFKNEDEHVLAMIERQYKDADVAAKYLDYQAKKGKIIVKNPCALLIKTLKDGLYSDVDGMITEEKQKKAALAEKTKVLKPVKGRELTAEEIKQQNEEWFQDKITELKGGVQNDNSANL